jgi:60Kd inner membrane protein
MLRLIQRGAAASPRGAVSAASVKGSQLRQLERLLQKEGIRLIPLTGRRFASTEGAAAATAASSVTGAPASVADHSSTFIPNIPPYEMSFGSFPDYSIVHKTGDAGGLLDSFMYYCQLPFLELHNFGVPWWGAIVGGTVLYRLVFGNSMMNSMAMGARMQNHFDEMQSYQKRMQVAQQNGDEAGKMAAAQELQAFMKRHNIKHLKMFLPILQLPLVFSLFWSVSRLARDSHLLEGFYNGGIEGWFPLLTQPDPTYVLPAIAVGGSLLSVLTNFAAHGVPQAELSPKGQKLLFGSLALGFGWAFTVDMPAVSTSSMSNCQQRPRLVPFHPSQPLSFFFFCYFPVCRPSSFTSAPPR